jgi:hypothetical protein
MRMLCQSPKVFPMKCLFCVSEVPSLLQGRVCNVTSKLFNKCHTITFATLHHRFSSLFCLIVSVSQKKIPFPEMLYNHFC